MLAETRALLVILAVVCAGAGSVTGEKPREPRLSASPMRLSDFTRIIPLGNLNPPGHTFPTDHIYFCQRDRNVHYPVFAPAGGTVLRLLGKRSDCKVVVALSRTVRYYLGHVRLVDAVQAGARLRAGQRIGTTCKDRSLDLGLIDDGRRLAGLASPGRYPHDHLHAVSPLRHYAGALRETLLARVDRVGADRFGKIDLDRPGRLVGNWFARDVPKDQRSMMRVYWPRHLAFTYDTRGTRPVRISVGGTICKAGAYAVGTGDPDPAEVSVGSGVVRYTLRRPGGGEVVGVLLVRLVRAARIQVQVFGPGARQPRFDERARIYQR